MECIRDNERVLWPVLHSAKTEGSRRYEATFAFYTLHVEVELI